MLQPIIKADKKELLFWLAIAVLLTLKIYEGDQSFFERHFSEKFTDSAWLNWYKWTYHFMSTFILFAIVPIIIIKGFFKNQLKDYGLQLGDWKFGIKATLAAFVILIVPVYLSSKNPEHLSFYPLTTLATKSPLYFLSWSFIYLPHYIGWELFFRGFIGFETKNRYGILAGVMLPSILTTLMHIGKPEGETWGALFGGIYLSLLTFRTNSILWALLFHWYLGIMNSFFCG